MKNLINLGNRQSNKSLKPYLSAFTRNFSLQICFLSAEGNHFNSVFISHYNQTMNAEKNREKSAK
jgi:hypothetical protein